MFPLEFRGEVNQEETRVMGLLQAFSSDSPVWKTDTRTDRQTDGRTDGR